MKREFFAHMSRHITLPALLLLCIGNFFTHEAKALSDPTRPGSYVTQDAASKPVEALRLESVLIARDRRVAVINGKTCRVGDNINGARLVAINADGAELVRDGNRVVLPLLKIQVRR
jgi:MSHA biogenesis protein MshK